MDAGHRERPEQRVPGRILLPALLAAITIAVYAPVRSFEFVNYDDPSYVVENPRVNQGLRWDSAISTLTAFENGNWHPLTLLSHMLDVQTFGLAPAGHHLVSLALHLANVLLLYLLLVWTTSRPWPSALVAALFAVHPLNVETVAWISERKSLLCTLFWLLALLAHARYRAHASGPRRALVWMLAGAALASKPMAVTLPLTLVLLDVWPLRTEPPGRGPLGRRYLRELAPLLGLSLVTGLLTLAAQRAGNALQSVESYPLAIRLGNAAEGYLWYLKALFWPAGLAVFYPHPVDTLAAVEAWTAAVVLAALSAAIAFKGRALPFLAMGWWWYVGTLLPVVGIVQVGSQAHADRYAYVPLVGIAVLLAWGAAKAVEEKPPLARRAVAALGMAWILALALGSRAQLAYWHDSVSLFRRAVDVVPDNAVGHNNLGMALAERGRMEQALAHFRAASGIAPWDTFARSNAGNALRALGRPGEAVTEYRGALEIRPDDASTHYNLATALSDLGRTDEAVAELREAVRLDPGHGKARALLAALLGGRRSP